jgi:hypothetical protein
VSRPCAVAGALALAALAGCGGSGSGGSGADAASSAVVWQGKPTAFSSKDKPNDRVVVARVRNRSSKPLRIDSAKVKVHDADGKVLRSYARFIASYAHGLYPAFQAPSELPPQEVTRLGYVVTIPPGKTAPLTVTWRVPSGSPVPATADLGVARLVLPARAAASH